MTDIKNELKSQIKGALAGANFPINSPEELLGAFPQGPDTTCEAGDVKLRAGDAGSVLRADDFPFQNADQVADAIVDRAVQ
ncbi:MAG: MTH865 family protein [Thermoleophilia bacterium]